VVVQNHWQNFIINVGSIESVNSLLTEMTAYKESSLALALERIHSGIQLENINFSYGNRIILDNVSMTIPVAKTIALVGASGAGKTTIANIIAGLITPNNGKVKVDDIDLRDLNINDYRLRIGYISQEPVIFNDTIYNNITFWSQPTEENLDKFKQVIRLTSLDIFIDGLPEGEETKLGDNGIMISGGQRQRISIARELFKNPEILILDEATSSLDAETELVIKENLKSLHGFYTMIVIAHRLSTIREADLIYVIEKGNVIDSGDYFTLINKSEKFKRMVSLQEV
jgi:ABC-type multidrug transport system fused ATPase/permease subunit